MLMRKGPAGTSKDSREHEARARARAETDREEKFGEARERARSTTIELSLHSFWRTKGQQWILPGSNGCCRDDLSLAHPPNPVFER